jgi:hypothetical protein
LTLLCLCVPSEQVLYHRKDTPKRHRGPDEMSNLYLSMLSCPHSPHALGYGGNL